MQYSSEFELGGEQRKFNFSVLVVGEVLKDLDVDIIGLSKLVATKNLLLIAPTILYRGHEHEVKKSGKAVDFTRDMVAEWCVEKENGVFNDDIQNAYIVFLDAIYKYYPVLEKLSKELGVEDEGSKKK